MSIQYGKHITAETIHGGEVTGIKHEYETSSFTDKQYLLKDVIDLLGTVSRGETSKLTIEVCVDKKNRYRLVSRWTA